jgi:hypothetical protein
MALPSVSHHLPASLQTRQSRRVAKFLRHADKCIEHSVSLVIYGSAAVALYLGDTGAYSYGYTDDIDVGAMEPEDVELSDLNAEIVDPPLHFQPYDFEQWLINPDWSDDTVDVSSLVGTAELSINLLHPVDLIITKMSRAADQDLEDSILLIEEYEIEESDEFRERLREAARFHHPSDRLRENVEWSYDALFDATIDLSGLF